jgi:2-dehydropantoate 2-reductase
MTQTTVAVVGVGAIGTVVAHALSPTADVTLCRRGSTTPMTLETDSGVHGVEARVVGSPDGLTPVDWVIVATKAQDTAGAGTWFQRLIGPDTRVAVLQNGIEHEERVAPWVTADRVVPVTVYIAAERIGSDRVVCRQVTGLTTPATAAAEEFAALFGGRIPVTPDGDFVTRAWSKLALNAALNPITAITDRSAEVVAQPAMRPLVHAIVEEAVAVGTAAGAFTNGFDMAAAMARLDALPRHSATSMQLDRRNSRPLEHEYLTGAIIRAADRYDIDVPNVRAIHALISAISAHPSTVLEAA